MTINSEKFTNYFLSLKFPFRLFAAIVIIFLGGTTIVITYKACLDVLSFFNLANITSGQFVKYLTLITPVLVGIATVVQSAPIIWDKMSYWGQYLDNLFIWYIFKKKYYLDEVNETLGNVRTLVNQINTEFQNHHWSYVMSHKLKNPDKLAQELTQLLTDKVAKATEEYYHVIQLLKNNDPYDNINRNRKNEANLVLNLLIVQLTEVVIKISSLINKIKKQKT